MIPALTDARALRVIPDASVLVSALLSPEGPSGCALRYFLEEAAFELILTDEIATEFQRTLGDRRVKRHLQVDAKDIARLTTAVTLLATYVEPRDVASEAVDVQDGDRKYLAAARAAAPCLLVTLDPTMLGARCPADVEIVSPRVLLELLEMAQIEGNSRAPHAFT